jgi:hypothetical protein
VAEAYHRCDEAEQALLRGDAVAALTGAEAGLALLPCEGNLLLIYIGALLGAGRLDEAAEAVKGLVAERPGWEGILRAIAERGLVPLPAGVTLDALLGRPAPP